jgi:hypothetical protein
VTKRKHWYFITRYFCVLCSHSEEIRERRFDDKPAAPEKRQEYIETACSGHFL